MSRAPMLVLPLILAFAAVAQTPPPADPPIAFAGEAIRWTDAPPSLPAGSQIAVLEGNPREEGMFTMRVKVPAGAVLEPHWHPRHERVTVLSGSVELGFGNVKSADVVRYGAGSFYVNPPRLMHFLSFPEETVLQMTGIGPWEIHTSDISPKQSAMAVLRIRSLSPAAGSRVNSGTKIVADVEYDVTGFRPETHYLTLAFETTQPGMTITGTQKTVALRRGTPLTPPVVPKLARSSGVTKVTADLGTVWGRTELRRPVRFQVYMHEVTSDTTTRVIGRTDWIEYR